LIEAAGCSDMLKANREDDVLEGLGRVIRGTGQLGGKAGSGAVGAST
jgi:hypothetical protein